MRKLKGLSFLLIFVLLFAFIVTPAEAASKYTSKKDAFGNYQRIAYSRYLKQNVAADTDRNIYLMFGTSEKTDIRLLKDITPNEVSYYKNTMIVYDWYSEHFSWKGMEGQGIPIVLLSSDESYSKIRDNAFFAHDCGIANEVAPKFNSLKITKKTTDSCLVFVPNALLSKPVGVCLDVVAHEYTHGVFDARTGLNVAKGHWNQSTRALSEAYADIFAALIDGNWALGEQIYTIRDLSDDDCDSLRILGISFEPDEHKVSLRFSHAAYMMHDCGFTDDEIANIFFQSLDKKYGWKLSTSISDAADIILTVMDERGYSYEDRLLVKSIFTVCTIKTTVKVSPPPPGSNNYSAINRRSNPLVNCK